MANTYFQFKQFTIHQEKCAMKVSTDAVVLGALVCPKKPEHILDIGTGTGVISLMLAQRFPKARIKAVEIDKPAYDQACQNITQSPWADNIKLSHQAFQEFSQIKEVKFDLIVSNPPYFPQHLPSKNVQRNMALHNDRLSFGDLIKGVTQLLDQKGEFWVILPPRQMEDLAKIAKFFHLSPKHLYELKDRPSSRTLRHIQCFSFGHFPIQQKTICIKGEDFNFSEEYRQLLKDFLLIF